jgi:5-dehydro-2-deoxygluconokinase
MRSGWYCLNQLDHYGVGTHPCATIKGEGRNSLAVVRDPDRRAPERDLPQQCGRFPDESRRCRGGRLQELWRADHRRHGVCRRALALAAFRAFELARAAGLPIIFDVDYRPYSWPSPQVAEEVLSRAGSLADVIVGNDEEFGFMAGDCDKGLDKARELAGPAPRSWSTRWARRARSRSPTARRSDRHLSGRGAQAHRRGRQFHGGPARGCRRARYARCRAARLGLRFAIVVSRPGCAPAMPDAGRTRGLPHIPFRPDSV